MRHFKVYLVLLYLLFISLLLIQCTTAQTPKKWKEKDYSDYIQTLIGGEREVTIPSGRVDLLTRTLAYEIEWANKWKDAIGQSLWYGIQTEHQPAIILIVRKKTDIKYVIQLNSTLQHSGLANKIKVSVFPYDFEEKMKGRKRPFPSVR